MTLTNVRTLPKLSGTLAALGPWQALLCRAGLRVYPYQAGALVRSTGSAPAYGTYGRGDFRTDNGTNYAMGCVATAYGGSTLYVPSTSLIAVLSSVSTTDDIITLASSISVAQYDYLFNLGLDTGGASPNYDGSLISIYDDNAGQTSHATRYLTTGLNGTFRGWLPAGTNLVDLLVTDSSGATPLVVIPFYDLMRTSSRQVIDPFFTDSIANGSAGPTTMKRLNTAPDFGQKWVAPRAGSLTGVWVKSDDARTAGTLTVEVYKNGSATGLQAILDETNTTFKFTEQAPHLDTFVAGDELTLQYTTASWTSSGGDADILGGLEVEV